MALPYSVLKVCGDIVFAARGGDIYSFTTGLEYISAWRYPAKQANAPSGPSSEPAAASPAPAAAAAPASPASECPPAKRRRVEPEDESASAAQTAEPETTEAKNKKPQQQQKKKTGHQKHSVELPIIQGLYTTTDDRYVVAITGSDKTIWVFEHDGAGNLKQLSQRMMSKRPCSLAITPDNKTILSADKFGDVFALPLIYSEQQQQQQPKETEASSAASTPVSTPSTPQSFKPQANELTIHTKRNLKALANQKLGLKHAGSAKTVDPVFEHTLLLGHVSMLTAIAVASKGDARYYIITADRDEHIRVSRGMPQAHVIEGFCLGHDEFVSRLCIPASRPEVLISGGGDDELFVWDWAAGKLLAKTNLLSHVQKLLPAINKIAVIRILACRPRQEDGNGPTWVFAVCERIPALFAYGLLQDGTLQHCQTIPTPGNPLDVEFLESTSQLLLAMDPDVASSGEGSVASSSLRVLSWEPATAGWQLVDNESSRIKGLPAADDGDAVVLSAEDVQRALYTTESLRKTNSEPAE
ncbi:hypothetical protein B0T22DRAFT_103876 [Podospora appendiculata]|uniref:Transfer RNA methyltransferase 82 n=1 Tax=Podospora appendiculata TaxID=314037 RepID=A0AAE0XL10_9PEZI|nr:hypothetical protein B0T22DRAFT_103876 [Podospora appendiculata]